MAVASPRYIATVIIIIEIGTQTDGNIFMAMTSPQTIATDKRSMIDKVTFVQTAVILWNIAAVDAMNRGDLIAILIMGGE